MICTAGIRFALVQETVRNDAQQIQSEKVIG
jgi:hypothetical protein